MGMEMDNSSTIQVGLANCDAESEDDAIIIIVIIGWQTASAFGLVGWGELGERSHTPTWIDFQG